MVQQVNNRIARNQKSLSTIQYENEYNTLFPKSIPCHLYESNPIIQQFTIFPNNSRQ